MLNDFLKPLFEPVDTKGKLLLIFLLIMLMGWIVGCFTKNYLVWLSSNILIAAIAVFIYCIIKKRKNEKN